MALVSEARRFLNPTRDGNPRPYRDDPVRYCAEVLRVSLTDDQATILRLMRVPPYRVMVPSGHNTGKTFLAAAAISWWFDSFDPGAVFTIGPRHDSLKDTIWGEVRRQRARAGLPDHFIGPQAPEMRTASDHWAKAFTAAKDASLTGRHLPYMLFVIEEACGVDPIWWEVITTMFDASLGHGQLCIFNPTDPTSQAFREDLLCDDTDGEPRWHRVRLSSLDHPNVRSQLAGGPKVVPHAVSLEQVNAAVRDMCEPVENREDVVATDLEWPPRSGHHFRPGPEFQCRWMGLWPDAGGGVWSPALWQACFPLTEPALPIQRLPENGVDCSQGKGCDYFALHTRWGAVSLYHETSNTMDHVRIAWRVREGCARAAKEYNARFPAAGKKVAPQAILTRMDDDGTGNDVARLLRGDGYNVQLVSGARRSTRPDDYPRMRDEAWFHSASKARAGLVCLSRLDRRTLARLRQQLMAPEFRLLNGQRHVESKDDTREKIGRSPDDADAFNLAYLDVAGLISGEMVPNELRQPLTEWGNPDSLRVDGRQKVFGLYGRELE
jgi:hypothetical protein